MKRTLILLAVVLLMVVAYELWNYNIGVNKLAPSKQDKSQASLSLNASTTHGTVPVPANIAISGKYEPWHGSQSQSLADPRWAVMHEREKADPNWQGKMSIEFYGKVLDEREQPIAGVDVEFGWTDMSVAGSTQKKTITDANGLFSLSGVKGKFLAVTVNKDGYYVAPGNRYGYEYAGFWDKAFFESDSSKPVIFHLRKKGVTESIIYHQKMFGFKPDGTQYFIDLKYGRKTANDAPSGGDFMVRLVRSETGKGEFFIPLNC